MTGPILLTGCHRSGTSALAQLLAAAGADLGHRLLPGNWSNPHGHYEDAEVVGIHHQLLSDNGLDWQVTGDFLPHVSADLWEAVQNYVGRPRPAGQAWGFKDPRSCLFLPLWLHAAPDLRIVAVVRDPASCVASMERRQAAVLLAGSGAAKPHWPFWTTPDHGARIWYAHNRALLRTARAVPDQVAIIAFEDLVDGASIVERLVARWNLPLQAEGLGWRWVQESSTQAEGLIVHDDGLRTQMNDLYEQLSALAGGVGATAQRRHHVASPT